MKPSEYLQYDATGLADLVRRGDVTQDEVVEAAIGRAEALNPRLNAICLPQYDSARQQPAGNGPLAGVPMLVKDLGQEQAGEPCTMGSQGFRDRIMTQDSEYVRRARDAGLVFLGRTATPEFGLKAVTESRLWGPTRNPWNTELTPGGSSGGSGAAVAAGIVPVAGANDGGGSIRIPAAYNGLVGLKPSRGRIPWGPETGESWLGAAENHVVTRTVRDTAALLDALAGPAVGDPFRIERPDLPWKDIASLSPGRLRIGMFTRSPYGGDVHPDCVAAVQEAARMLESLGHVIEEAEPAVDGQDLARCYLGIYFGEVSAFVQQALEGGADRDDFELDTRVLAMLGRSFPLPDYVRMRQRWNDFARATGGFFGRHDLYLCPTTAQPPARIGELDMPPAMKLLSTLLVKVRAGAVLHRTGMVDQLAMESLARTPFTQLANLTGTPAISVPVCWSPQGLPVGVQFGAAHGGEGLLLQLAAQLEEASPWYGRYESLWEASEDR
ncbi:amidase [Marinobacter daqiaonensis]|uniref:Amidase n=1 Tax=Marinobacter daqiaonensis TaxID=650891 RepID=A0A1I6IJS9_9GAMM|nr:amidase family protein [Marinobacter daqiaonensis]SFR66963.1 amidase [Marinobacter daqiaonensis]